MFSKGLWPGSCSCISQRQTLSPAKRARYVTDPGVSLLFLPLSQYVTSLRFFSARTLIFPPDILILNMKQQSLPEIKISSPYLHYQYICVSCLQSRICYATLLLPNVQNQSFLHEPLKKDGEGKKYFRYSKEIVICNALLAARTCLDV